MQGVPAHLTTLRKPINEKRRHPAHCIYSKGTGKNRICTAVQCTTYDRNCRTSVHCEYYIDDRNED